jgi:hypothetical protein
MKKNYKSCIAATFVATAALFAGSSAFAAHTQPIPLLDAAGNAITYGLGTRDDVAYSAKQTCGRCHDYNKIERHSFHAQLGANEHKGWNPWKYGNMNSVASKGKPWVQSTGHVGKW